MKPEIVSSLDSSSHVALHQSTYLHVYDLAMRYGNNYAFRDVTFAMAENQITCLIGASGCGKSSIMSAINGMWKHLPHCSIEGSINYLQKNGEQRKHFGTIFQTPSPFPFSIYKNFALPLKEHGVKNKTEIERRMQHYLELTGLWTEVKDKLKKSATTLSGGQQQRLCIARALALQPKALFLDEPCSALDPLSTHLIEALLLELKKSMPIFLITHNLAQAKRVADQLVFMASVDGIGRIIEQGRKHQILQQPKHHHTRTFMESFFR